MKNTKKLADCLIAAIKNKDQSFVCPLCGAAVPVTHRFTKTLKVVKSVRPGKDIYVARCEGCRTSVQVTAEEVESYGG